MSYTIRPITNGDEWKTFFNAHNVDTFLHTWEYGLFNERISKRDGESVIRIGVYDGATLVGIALFLKIVAKRSSFLFCPHGPVVNNDDPNIISAIIQHSIELTKKEKVDFLRYSPLLLDAPETVALFSNEGFRPAPIHQHPELAWILDITPSEDDLMSQMRKTSRHSIRKAEKSGVVVRQSTSEADVKIFNDLYQATVARQGFTPFSLSYLNEELNTFRETDSIGVFVAEYNGEPVASSMVIFTPYSAFYHQGASVRKYPKINAPHLLQWTAIKEAKRRGCQRYNFWGIISTETQPNHPWKGLSLFKKGFGGYSQAYVHAQDKPLTAKYWLNFAVEHIRKKKRGY